MKQALPLSYIVILYFISNPNSNTCSFYEFQFFNLQNYFLYF